MGHITVNPLLSPPGSLFFSSTFEGGLNREGGLKSEGGGGAYLIQIHGVRQKIILHLLVLAHRSTIYPSCNLK